MDNTFQQDFTIADHFGANAVTDTFNRAFKEWRNDYKMLTELVMVLNHKIWQHYEQGDNTLAQLYNKYWETADAYAMDNLKDDQLSYFLEVTD